MENKDHTLIKDETETRRFLEKVLLPLKEDEVYIVVLTARKKYCPSMSSSLEVVSRDIIRNNDKDKIVRKLRRLSVTEGIYTDSNNNIIPSSAFAMYILPEPRSTLKAYIDFTNQINKWLHDSLRSENKNTEIFRKLDAKLFSSIHKSRAYGCYFIIDIDKKDEKLFNNIYLLIKSKEGYDHSSVIQWISETRGGYHIILNKNNISGEIVHEIMMKKMDFVEFRRETMTPIPGTSQGGFVVKEKQI